jgi:hypothetical protein
LIPQGSDHLSEAAIDTVHLSNLIDNFITTQWTRYIHNHSNNISIK